MSKPRIVLLCCLCAAFAALCCDKVYVPIKQFLSQKKEPKPEVHRYEMTGNVIVGPRQPIGLDLDFVQKVQLTNNRIYDLRVAEVRAAMFEGFASGTATLGFLGSDQDFEDCLTNIRGRVEALVASDHDKERAQIALDALNQFEQRMRQYRKKP